MKARYIKASEDQINWGKNTDPRPLLKPGQIYDVIKQDVKSWHTKYTLKNIPGVFNSSSFETV